MFLRIGTSSKQLKWNSILHNKVEEKISTCHAKRHVSFHFDRKSAGILGTWFLVSCSTHNLYQNLKRSLKMLSEKCIGLAIIRTVVFLGNWLLSQRGKFEDSNKWNDSFLEVSLLFMSLKPLLSLLNQTLQVIKRLAGAITHIHPFSWQNPIFPRIHTIYDIPPITKVTLPLLESHINFSKLGRVVQRLF